MSRTREEHLNDGSASAQFAVAVAGLRFEAADGTVYGLGSVLKGMSPGLALRTGLASSATHVEDLPGRVHAVVDEAGAVNLTIVYAGAAGAGEVLVTYSTVEPVGVPTLVFGDGANTGYQIDKDVLPTGWLESLEAIAS
jgi:hypothetical protein